MLLCSQLCGSISLMQSDPQFDDAADRHAPLVQRRRSGTLDLCRMHWRQRNREGLMRRIGVVLGSGETSETRPSIMTLRQALKQSIVEHEKARSDDYGLRMPIRLHLVT